MLNDCWPAALGRSLIDYYCMPKAAYYSFKRCTKPVVCSIDKKDDVYSMYVSNDSGADVDVEYKLYALSEGVQKEIGSGHVLAESGETVAAYSISCEDNGVLIGEISGTDVFDRGFYKDGALHTVKRDIEYIIDEEKNMIFVKAENDYIHAVDIEGNILPEDNYFSLLPGEGKWVKYEKFHEELPLDAKVEGYGLKQQC